MTVPALEVRGVDVRFADDLVLRSVKMRVEPGERFVVVGPSGSGKTTLLRTIAGFVIPDSGEISIAGRTATALPPEKRDTVYMPGEWTASRALLQSCRSPFRTSSQHCARY